MSGTYCTDGSLCMIGCSESTRKCEHAKPLQMWEVVQQSEQLEWLQAELHEAQVDTEGFMNGMRIANAALTQVTKKNTELVSQVAAVRIYMDKFPEISPNNYNYNDVLALNDWGIGFSALIVSNLPAEAEKLVRLVAAIDELLVWDKATAAGVSKPYTAFNADQTLVGIIEKLRDLRGEK